MAEHLLGNSVPQSQLWPFITWGRPNKPPIVFLHGFLGAGSDWGEIAAPLAEDYFCVCPDLPGHGANITRDLNAQLSIPQLALELRALCAALSLSAPIVVGYSLGGRVALAAALFPARTAPRWTAAPRTLRAGLPRILWRPGWLTAASCSWRTPLASRAR